MMMVVIMMLMSLVLMRVMSVVHESRNAKPSVQRSTSFSNPPTPL